MRRGNRITFIDNAAGVCTAAIAFMLIVFSSSSVNAQQTPRKGCVAVDKREYDAAKREKLLRDRYSTCEDRPVMAALLLVLSQIALNE